MHPLKIYNLIISIISSSFQKIPLFCKYPWYNCDKSSLYRNSSLLWSLSNYKSGYFSSKIHLYRTKNCRSNSSILNPRQFLYAASSVHHLCFICTLSVHHLHIICASFALHLHIICTSSIATSSITISAT